MGIDSCAALAARRQLSATILFQHCAWLIMCLPTSICMAHEVADGPDALSHATAMPSGPDQLAEVIITAEKRESTVQSTAISLTALSGTELAARGLTSIVAVAEETPGISFRSAGPGQTEFEMRGVSSTGGSVGTVGFYLDETPMTPPSFGAIGKVVINPDLFDLRSVEVLRGPQGTLYGAGSMGGTIRVLTNSPALNRWDVSAEAVLSDTAGTDGQGFNRGANLMLNVPIRDDSMALRLTASSHYRDGWLDRIVVSPFPFPASPCDGFSGCERGDVASGAFSNLYRRTNWARTDTIRPTLLIEPNEQLKITLSMFYQRTRMGGYDTVDVPPGCESDRPCGHFQPLDVPEPFSDTVKVFSGVVHYDAPFARLTSATSYWTRSEQQTQDATEAFQNILALPQFVAVPNPETDHSEQFSEEIRLTSAGEGALQWLGGLFFSNFHYLLAQNLTSAYFSDPVANPSGQLYVIRFPYDTKQYAAFAEASYKLTPAWKVTVGLRAFRYQSTVNATESGLFTPNGDATPFEDSVETSNHGLTPKLNLAYMPNPDVTLYGTASKGFRPGGISEPLPVSGPASCLPSLRAIGFDANAVSYGPDSLWNFEVGEKVRLMDRRLTIHSDVFFIRWNDIQQVVPLSCGYLLEANSGQARSYGPEIELTASVVRGLTLSINGAYTKAELSHPASFAGQPGQPLLNVPKYMGAASLVYTRPLRGGLTLNSRVSTSITGPQWDIAYAPQELPSFALTNLRLGIAGDHWSAALFANNVTNRIAIQTINNTSLSLNAPTLTRATVNQPRTIGLDLRFDLH